MALEGRRPPIPDGALEYRPVAQPGALKGSRAPRPSTLHLQVELRVPFVELTLRISAARGPCDGARGRRPPLPAGALNNRPVAQPGALKGFRGPHSSGLHLQVELRAPFVELTLRISAARGPGRRSRGDDLPLLAGALEYRPVAQPGALKGSGAPSSSGHGAQKNFNGQRMDTFRRRGTPFSAWPAVRLGW